MSARILRQGYLDSEKIESLSLQSRDMFIRLILVADDYGRFDGRNTMIKSHCYPISEKITTIIVEKCIKELTKLDLVYRYVIKNKEYIQIINFNQRLRTMKSKYPEPDNPQQVAADCGGLRPESKQNRNETELSDNALSATPKDADEARGAPKQQVEQNIKSDQAALAGFMKGTLETKIGLPAPAVFSKKDYIICADIVKSTGSLRKACLSAVILLSAVKEKDGFAEPTFAHLRGNLQKYLSKTPELSTSSVEYVDTWLKENYAVS